MIKLRLGLRSFVLNKKKFTQHGTRNYVSNIIMPASKTIKDLGYGFNTDGQLRKIEQNGEVGTEPFQFNISDHHQECQAHYELLGTAITEHIYHLLETETDLIRLPVPKNSTEENGTFVFASKNSKSADTLVVLIQGSGAVRAGQWARSLIINDCLDTGTQIPYIRKVQARDYGVIVLNPNDNYRNETKIPHSGSAEDHVMYVWNEYIAHTKAHSIYIVAHSYGGVLTIMLADKQKDAFEKRVKAVALTDSVHCSAGVNIPPYLKKVSRNWVASTAPLNSPILTPNYDIARVSAGHPKHEMTSSRSINSIFKFFAEKIKEEI